MSISRSGMGPFNPATQTGSMRSNLTTQEDAARAEREARDRIARAQEETQRAETAETEELDRQRGKFDLEYTKESINNEAALEKLKQEGYEQVRKLQRAQQAELRRIQREGEKSKQQMGEHFRDSINNLEAIGREQTHQLLTQKAKELDYERTSADMELEHMKGEEQIRQKELKDNEEYRYGELLKAARGRYEQMRDKTAQQTEHEEQHFKERYAETVKHHDELVNRVEARAARDVEAIRADTTEKISAYSSRQSDPFYHMKSVSGRVYDDGDQYIMLARIPPHEREHVTVSIKGDQVVLSGYRKSSDSTQVSPGHTRSTSAYQSYTETFPLHWPVDSRNIRKEFEGDTMIVAIPKKARASVAPQFKAAPPKARVEGPKYPPDLKIPSEMNPVGEPPSKSRKDRDSGTFS